eukprot:TRINITY_DN1208_c0_g1_i1.p1 TRINITY_DN1208_c0_g1~~TRINITY_DN1208_c0_g1_i1.p1  ORF type:complete len:166 (-),score=48.94 TRINITY_DN1208_c0_g1_i1:32-529(-)
MNFAIDDERIMDYDQVKTPAQILQEYCTRYHASVEYEMIVEGEIDEDKKFKIIAISDSVRAEGMGKTKKEAKQRASQLLLKQLHPDLRTWQQLIDLYSSRSTREDDRDKRPRGPNFHLLEKLKEEMRKCISSDIDPNVPPISAYDVRDGMQMSSIAKRRKTEEIR